MFLTTIAYMRTRRTMAVITIQPRVGIMDEANCDAAHYEALKTGAFKSEIDEVFDQH